MTEEQFGTLLSALRHISWQLNELLRAKAAPKPANKPRFWQATLEEFEGFDWGRIGAIAIASDGDGPTVVEWEGNRYTRRSPSNKFKPAIWYSRAIGKDDKGEPLYERLITFAPAEAVEPVSRKVKQHCYN